MRGVARDRRFSERVLLQSNLADQLLLRHTLQSTAQQRIGQGRLEHQRTPPRQRLLLRLEVRGRCWRHDKALLGHPNQHQDSGNCSGLDLDTECNVGDVQNGDVLWFPAYPYPTGYSLNTGVNNREFGSFPTITFATSNVVQLGIGGRSGRRGPQGQFNYKDTVSYLRGGHAFKFGGEMVRVKFRNKSTQNTMGTIAFDTLTNFLAGTPVQGSSSIIIGNPEDNFRSKWFAGFIQDTWRITSTITVSPGVRYEYQGPPHDVHNYLGTFDASVPGGVAQVGPGLPHSKLYNPEKADFSPRFGIAWDIWGK